jgi:hypothetical protein
VGKFVYNGDVDLVLPSLGLTITKGDVFEAPDDLNVVGIAPSKAKVTVSADATPVADTKTSEAPDEAPAETPTDTAAPAASN